MITKQIRRSAKKQAKQIVKKHYFILVFVCLIAIIFGSEKLMSNPIELLKGRMTSETTESSTTSDIDTLSLTDVIEAVINDRIEQGDEKTKEAMEKYQKESKENSALGRRRGVFADLINRTSSGNIFIIIALGLHQMTHSNLATSVIMGLGGIIVMVFFYVFVLNVLTVVLRRITYETRTYEHVPVSHMLSLLGTHQLANVGLTILLKDVFLSLWSLTVIGGVIKHYSYWMVNYIMAESPSVKPREAIRLSRKMMYSHKWAICKMELSLIGWDILSVLTYGISDIIFGLPYRFAIKAELATHIREQAFINHIDGVEVLHDALLFKPADEATLRNVYDDTLAQEAWIKEHDIELHGVQKFFAEWFGFWVGPTKDKRAYQEVENKKYTLRENIEVVNGRAYPYRLNPDFRSREAKESGIPFLRTYTIWSLLSMFLVFSFIGWLWEVSLTLISSGNLVNRGMLHGPWLPIYGEGLVLILILGAHFRKKPGLEFIVATTLCGCLEYYTAYYMWIKFHKKWWDYTGYFLNLHGRICAEGLLVFGIGGLAIVYLIGPLHDTLVSKINQKIIIPVVLCLTVVFGFDYIYSQKHPNEGKGVTDTGSAIVEIIELS